MSKEVKFHVPECSDTSENPPKDKVPKIYIAIAGASGSGKSSFIKKVTEQENIPVGGNLQSSM